MGAYGEVRGETKIDTYVRYVEECNGWDGDHYPDPRYKKWCYRLMERDTESGEWVLSFHFHTSPSRALIYHA